MTLYGGQRARARGGEAKPACQHACRQPPVPAFGYRFITHSPQHFPRSQWSDDDRARGSPRLPHRMATTTLSAPLYHLYAPLGGAPTAARAGYLPTHRSILTATTATTALPFCLQPRRRLLVRTLAGIRAAVPPGVPPYRNLPITLLSHSR